MKITILIKNQFIKFFYYFSKALDLDKSTSRIICYHSISEKGNKYSIGLNQFKNEILTFKKYYKFVAVDKILQGENSHKTQPTIALTIDDGYEDVLQVVNFLKINDIPVLLFVLANPDKADRRELDHSGKLLTNTEIKNLHRLGWTIGCHSATHADFSKLDKNAMEKEIIDSKKYLEKQLGFPINYFAYPKGVYSEDIINVVNKAGYKAAFTTIPGVIGKKINKYELSRFVMEKIPNIFSIPFSFSYATQILRNFTH